MYMSPMCQDVFYQNGILHAQLKLVTLQALWFMRKNVNVWTQRRHQVSYNQRSFQPCTMPWTVQERYVRCCALTLIISYLLLADHLLGPVPKQAEDKRLAIEPTAMRQVLLWTEDEELTSVAYAPYGTTLSWMATHLQVADALTKSMKPRLLNQVLDDTTAKLQDPT